MSSIARPGLALPALAGTVLLFGGTAGAQRAPGHITGIVRVGQAGPVVAGARITLVGTQLIVTTNADGAFTLWGIAPGKYTVQVSAIGYSTLSSDVDLKDNQTLRLTFETEVEAVDLPALAVEERPIGPPDFLRRMTEGRGRYFTREAILKRNTNSLADLLRSVPGLRVECRRAHVCSVTMMRSRRDCGPGYFVDGVPTDSSYVWLIRPRDLQGVEVYSGAAATPAELERFGTCGAIALWTRVIPPGGRSP